jgi:hypothetical protein
MIKPVAALPTATRGAISEMRAGIYLLERGYHVFWSMSPACPVDLLAYRPGEMPVKVEVKTLSVLEVNETRRCRTLVLGWPRNDVWDLLLAVGPDEVYEVWSPAEYRETLERFRKIYGFLPAPLRARKGTEGLHQPPGQDRPTYNMAVGSEWV